MVEPDLAGAERALRREMLARGDILAVGAPGRRVEQAEGLARDRPRARAVGVHHPDIVAAAAVRGEGDQPPVGREARLHVEGEARADPRRPPAGDRHGVDVAEQVEGDRPPVRADVDVHPGALVDVDRHLAQARARRRVDVPGRRLARRRRRARGCASAVVETSKSESAAKLRIMCGNPLGLRRRKGAGGALSGKTGKRRSTSGGAWARLGGMKRRAALGLGVIGLLLGPATAEACEQRRPALASLSSTGRCPASFPPARSSPRSISATTWGWFGSDGLSARVRRTIQGDYRGETVIVRSRIWTSCDSPFANGSSGFLIGTPRGMEHGKLVGRSAAVLRAPGSAARSPLGVPSGKAGTRARCSDLSERKRTVPKKQGLSLFFLPAPLIALS